MRRDPKSHRSIFFLNRNNLENKSVQEYVIRILQMYDIKIYEFKPYEEYGIALYLTCKWDYILYLDPEFVELKSISNRKSYKSTTRGYVDDTCWKKAIRDIYDWSLV